MKVVLTVLLVCACNTEEVARYQTSKTACEQKIVGDARCVVCNNGSSGGPAVSCEWPVKDAPK